MRTLAHRAVVVYIRSVWAIDDDGLIDLEFEPKHGSHHALCLTFRAHVARCDDHSV